MSHLSPSHLCGWFLPVFLDRVPALAKSLLVGVAVLRDDGGDTCDLATLMEIKVVDFRRRGEDSIEPRPQRSNHFRIAARKIEARVRLSDGQIVGMIHASSGLPFIGFAHRE